MRPDKLSFCVLALVVAASTAAGAPSILTAPVGLVNGELQVKVDLGVSSAGAVL